MMQKTTLYLEDKELRDLKKLATQIPGGSSASLIRKAVRDLLRKRHTSPAHQFLRKALRRKRTRTSFGDPILYQRALRKEWQ